MADPKGALRAPIWTRRSAFGSEFGRGAEFRGPDAIRRIGAPTTDYRPNPSALSGQNPASRTSGRPWTTPMTGILFRPTWAETPPGHPQASSLRVDEAVRSCPADGARVGRMSSQDWAWWAHISGVYLFLWVCVGRASRFTPWRAELGELGPQIPKIATARRAEPEEHGMVRFQALGAHVRADVRTTPAPDCWSSPQVGRPQTHPMAPVEVGFGLLSMCWGFWRSIAKYVSDFDTGT